MKRYVLYFLAVCVLCQVLLATEAKNVILMISDGAGFNTYDSASYYQYGKLGSQPYDTFPVRMSCTTFAHEGEYDPEAFWADFEYGKKKATDSAASATALNTGQKTKNGKISVSPSDMRMVTFAEIADLMGKNTGVVTSVPISHATPGAVWAHNKSRNNYTKITKEMILDSSLEVIFGAGHPYFDDDGKSRKPEYKYIDKKLFESLKSGRNKLGWKFIDQKKDFEQLANNPAAGIRKIIGIPQAASTLQQKRENQELNKTVPDLPTMARAALNVLGQNPNGFYLMIEGGAVDWANHANELDRAVQEQVDFNKTIQAVLDWLTENEKLEETLIIITADHECGGLWGTQAGEKSDTPFDLPKNAGRGKLPEAKHYSKGHTNALVPLYSQGPGCEEFLWHIKGVDVKAAKTWGFSGNYVDNTDVFTVMLKAVKSKIIIK